MSELVVVRQALPAAIVDYRYITEANITGHPLPECGPDMLIAETLIKPLTTVCQQLARLGLRLVIWDAHRTQAAQAALRAICPDEKYVLKVSNHVADKAVDVTLADNRGRLLDMGTDFDDMTERAHRNFPALTDDQRRHRAWLQMPMESAGFVGWPYEWWHFDYTGQLAIIDGIHGTSDERSCNHSSS